MLAEMVLLFAKLALDKEFLMLNNLEKQYLQK